MSHSIALTPDNASNSSQALRDWFGIAASLLCAIHCAAMPFVVGFLPLLGLSFLADPSFHKWMVGVCLVLALLAFVPGWRRHHRLAPAIIGMVGLGFISFAAFAGPEDCCPTPCGETTAAVSTDPDGTTPCAAACCSTTTDDSANVELVALVTPNEETACAATCCSSTTTDANLAKNSSKVVDASEKTACASSCCASSETTADDSSGVELVATVTPVEEAPCSAECCPTEGDAFVTAGSGEFMSLVWLLMTPFGGVILVTAHLANHRLSCTCSSSSCSHSENV